MKISALVFTIYFILIICDVVLAEQDDGSMNWADFKSKFRKKYSPRVAKWRKLASTFSSGPELSDDERHQRQFERTLENIRKHNANPEAGYKIGLNQFSDLSLDEFRRTSTGLKLPKKTESKKASLKSSNSAGNRPRLGSGLASSFPEELDWVKKGFVTAVADQGECGSCWAFATTAVLESRHMILNNETTVLSTQNLVDCSKIETEGCDGGWYGSALDHIKEKGGLNHQAAYPYKGEVEKCTFDGSLGAKYATNLDGYDEIREGDEMAVIEALQSGPVIAAVQTTRNFKDYKSGIFDDKTCSNDVDHAIAIVGYGKDSNTGQKYWLIKNSWNESWGEKGYMRMIRRNICGILNLVLAPKLSKKNHGDRFFGGALACRPGVCIPNAITSNFECPKGTKKFDVAKPNSDVNDDILVHSLCVAPRADPEFNFGGMYFKCDTCKECPFSWKYNTPNPLTGDYTCPKGYGTINFRMLSPVKGNGRNDNVGCAKTICFNNIAGGKVGGFFQYFTDGSVGTNAVPNPVTGWYNCPEGYDRKWYGAAKAPENKFRRMWQFYCLKREVAIVGRRPRLLSAKLTASKDVPANDTDSQNEYLSEGNDVIVPQQPDPVEADEQESEIQRFFKMIKSWLPL